MLITLIIALFILIGLILLRINAFLAFLISSISAGLIAGMDISAVINAVEKGLGNSLGSLTIILGFGAVIGRFMAISGAAEQISSSLVQMVGPKYLKWAMMGIGFIVGLPMFFAVGFVILVPIVFSIAKKAGVSIIYLGIPLVASLSVAHGLLPPHPAPVALVQLFNADMGETIFYGIVIAIPAMILAGPLFASALKKIEVEPLKIFISEPPNSGSTPSLWISVFCALLPIFLLMSETIFKSWINTSSWIFDIMLFVSQPIVAMLISVVVIAYLLGIKQGKKLSEIMKTLEESISGIAMILLIIGGAGALNQDFAEIGLTDYLVSVLRDIDISPIILCWGMAAIIRIAIGSATVAALTTAGLLAPVYASISMNPVLLVLATGSGSLIFSHVNDGGFWLFKEYFNLSIKQTLLSWSMMETLIAVCGLAACLFLNMFI